MMSLKPGVKALGIRPEVILGLIVAEGCYQSFNVEMVVTSIADSRHSLTSLHYTGCAVDLRTRTVLPEERQALCTLIASKLSNDYDVILENDHIHLEFQPKRQ